MAAISHVFTIRRAAQILGRDEDLLWELSDQLEPEDGKLWVYDIDALKPPPSPTMASRRFAKLSRIRSIAPVNLKTSVPRCSAYAYDAGGPKEQAHLSLGQEGFTPPCRPRSKDPIDLPVRCGLPRTRSRRRPRAAGLQHRSYAASPR